jgi:membrane-bound lytic murein transglycosylase B
MNRWFRRVPFLILALILSAPSAARAQAAKPDAMQPPHALVTIYRIAPGKHLDFLKWMAETEAIAKEAGVPAGQFYAHTDGDSWDYLNVAPDLTKEQQTKVDEVTKKHGRKTGFVASLDFRTFVASHTDTFAIGPVSAADLVAMAK